MSAAEKVSAGSHACQPDGHGRNRYPGSWAISTPRAIVDKLNAQTRKALASPEIKDFFSAQGMEVQATSPEEFRAFIEKEIPKWARIIKEAKVTLQ